MYDLAHAGRTLRRQPWFTAVAALTFAVGIGLNVAVFSVVDRVLVRKLPYHEPDRLAFVRLCTDVCGTAFPAALAGALRDLPGVEGVAFPGFPAQFTLTREPGSARINLFGASPGTLRVLGVAPAIGRDFTEDDLSSGRPVALISHESWHARFGGATGIVGTEIWSDAGPRTVVGVLPAGFIPPVWVARIPGWDGFYLSRTGWFAGTGPDAPTVVGPLVRLRAGVTPAAAQEDVRRLARLIESEWSAVDYFRDAAERVRVDPIQTALFEAERPAFALLLGATAILLLLACANLSTLLLARGRTRDRDLAIAASLGATAKRLMRQALLESWLVCALGAAVALSVLTVAGNVLTSLLPPLVARYTTPITEVRVLAIAIGIATACALVAGLAPAARSARVDLLGVLQRTTVSARRLRSGARAGLIATETALGVVLTASALLLLQSLTRMANEDVGYQPQALYLVSVGSQAPAARGATFFGHVADALGVVPGIASVAVADSTGVGGMGPFTSIQTAAGTRVARYEVSASFFETAGARMIAGRSFTAGEVRQRARVAVLNTRAASDIWPGDAPDDIVGRVLSAGDESPFQILGVVPEFKMAFGDARTVGPAVYLPYGLHGDAWTGEAIVRTHDGSAPPVAVVQQWIRDRVVGATTVWVDAIEARYTSALAEPRFRAVLFGTLALAGLLLAVTGLYAVAAFDTRQREYEIGVRLAHGATPADVRRLVIAQGLLPVLMGLTAGLISAFWTTTLLQQFLYQVEPRNPGILAAVAGIMIVTAFAATWFPAWRASRLDPAVVLRAE